MVRDALAFACDFQKIERDTLAALSPVGAALPVDAVADVMERLSVWRSWAVSVLIGALKEAKTEQERRDIQAALLAVKPSERAF